MWTPTNTGQDPLDKPNMTAPLTLILLVLLAVIISFLLQDNDNTRFK